jgi:hypothetical protein
MRLKAFMTLQHARARELPQESIMIEIDFRNPRLDVGKRDWIILVNQISQEKARPRVSRPEVRNQKDVIGESSESMARDPPSREHTPRLG